MQNDNEEAYYPGFESSSLLFYGSEWIREIRTKKKNFLKRNIKCFGENLIGNSVLLCRYLTALRPPQQLFDACNPVPGEHLTDTMVKSDKFAIEKVARYVSMIPFVEDMNMFSMSEMPDLFATC